MPRRVNYTGPAPHNLRAWRKHAKMTLLQLGDAVGASKPHMSNLETGQTGLTIELAELIAKHLGITVEMLRNRLPDDEPNLEEDLLTLFRSVSEKAQKAILDSARAIATMDRGG